MLTLKQLQGAQRAWVKHNFPDRTAHGPLLGVTEELGELAECHDEPSAHIQELMKVLGRLSHAHLKNEQGIRGSELKHYRDKIDAVADIIIFLADYCTVNEIDLQTAVEKTWAQVSKRDWQKDALTGVSQ